MWCSTMLEFTRVKTFRFGFRAGVRHGWDIHWGTFVSGEVGTQPTSRPFGHYASSIAAEEPKQTFEARFLRGLSWRLSLEVFNLDQPKLVSRFRSWTWCQPTQTMTSASRSWQNDATLWASTPLKQWWTASPETGLQGGANQHDEMIFKGVLNQKGFLFFTQGFW